MTTGNEPWWVSAFRSDYLRVYSHRDLDSARVEVAGLVDMGLEGRVLDVACGWGRHSLALQEQGLDVIGVDFSAELLERAPDAIRARLVRGDARRLPFAAQAFDGVTVLFSSFGYFGADGDRAMLGEVARVLRPGGLAVLDLMNPARVRAGLVPRTESERAEYRLIEERRLEDDGARVVKEVRQEAPDGTVRAWREDVRLYEPAEIDAAARELGLEPTAVHGGFDGSRFTPAAERQLVLARRA